MCTSSPTRRSLRPSSATSCQRSGSAISPRIAGGCVVPVTTRNSTSILLDGVAAGFEGRHRYTRPVTLTFRPSPALRSCVSSIIVRIDDDTDAERTFERVLPTGGVGVVVNLRHDELRTYDDAGVARRASGAILSGPHSRARVIDTAETGAMVHVGFRRGGV